MYLVTPEESGKPRIAESQKNARVPEEQTFSSVKRDNNVARAIVSGQSRRNLTEIEPEIKPTPRVPKALFDGSDINWQATLISLTGRQVCVL